MNNKWTFFFIYLKGLDQKVRLKKTLRLKDISLNTNIYPFVALYLFVNRLKKKSSSLVKQGDIESSISILSLPKDLMHR